MVATTSAAAVDSLSSMRSAVLLKHIAPGADTLEIGAFARPTLRKPEFNASFLDFYSTAELKEQCKKYGGDPDAVMDVDFVVRAEDYTPYVNQTFDAVIANHVLEHIRNPIKWLIDIAELVRHDGFLFISLPDKRFSFDKFRDETALSHILSDFLIEGRDLESEHCIETEIFYDRQYIKQERSLNISLSVDRIRNASKKFHPGIHCHVFDGRNFQNKILKPLIYMQLIPWTIVDYVPETPAGEFYALLRKSAPVTDLTEQDFFQEV
jgi:SAM-dependent methyltransferase